MPRADTLRVVWRDTRQHPGRLAATCLAITISVAFLVACLTFVATETHSIGRRLTASTSTSDVVAQLGENRGGAVQREIAALPGVQTVAPTYSGYAEFTSPSGPGQLELSSLPPAPFRWSTLYVGAWPQNASEIALGTAAAKNYGLVLGSTLTLAAGPGGGQPMLKVVGLVDESRSLFGQMASSAVVDDTYFTSAPDEFQFPTLLILAVPGTDPEALVQRIQSLVGPDASVQTSAALTDATLAQMTNDAAVFRYLLLVFAAIALLVGAMIIINTFTIIVAQRRRQLGLLRTVGASTSQVRRRLLIEAGLVGVIGSAAGVILGLMITVIAAAVSGSLSDGLVAPLGQLAAAFAAGVVVTGLAALVPAHRAARVAPLEALRPVPDPAAGRQATRLRALLSGLIILVGAGTVAYALHRDGSNVPFAVAGAAVLAVGILAGAPVGLPYALRAIGVVARRLGVTSRLAAANLLRNPGRAAATCTALMLVVGLVVTLQVGAATLKATTNDSLDLEFPVDVTVTNSGGPLAAGVLTSVAAVSGITATTPVRMTEAGVDRPGEGVESIEVAGLGPDAAAVVSSGFDQLTPGIALAHAFNLQMLDQSEGDPITLVVGGRRESFTLRESDAADAGMLVVTAQALSELDPKAPVASVWAAADRDQAGEVVAGVRRAMAGQPGLQLAGSLEQAASVGALLDTVLAVATGLLAVAVAIALVGVGNTLGLSVIERTRELALLRALGLRRGQLRLTLGIEAVLLAMVGAVIGVGAGVLFGTVGVLALVKETSLDAFRFAMSGPQTLAVVLVSGVAAALASVLPGRRAAMTPPTQALAEV